MHKEVELKRFIAQLRNKLLTVGANKSEEEGMSSRTQMSDMLKHTYAHLLYS